MSNYKDLELKELNYNSYLKIKELLSLQNELSDPPHHDEMFFIIIHQAAELWFKLMRHETAALIQSFREDSVSRALKKLKRLTAVMSLMDQQINLLNTLTPVEFAGFRDHLRPASGFQSKQFRFIEYTFGLREKFFQDFFKNEPEIKNELIAISKQPSVYDEFLKSLSRAGYEVPREILERDLSAPLWQESPELTQTLLKIYQNPGENYHWVLLMEALVDFDEKFALWRSTHMLMVARTIGMQSGTGGSSGHSFLQSRAHFRFFPEIWAVRTAIGKY